VSCISSEKRTVQPVQVDRGEYVRHFGCNVELGEQFDLAAGGSTCNFRVTVTKYS